MNESIFSFEAIGTSWAITIKDSLEEGKKISLLQKIKDRIAVFDKTYSRFREDSLVMEMARKPGTYMLPADAETLLVAYKKVYDMTKGKVTPLIGDVLIDAGYDASYSLVQKKELTKPLPWEEVLDYQYPKIVLKTQAVLDFGAGGKGYLIDIVAKLLEREGMREFCIDAGGDILVRSGDQGFQKVGLEDPQDTTKVIGTRELKNQSIAGSAGNRRVWGAFHHVIDPQSLTSPKHLLGLWVIADTTLVADLLATALFFTAPEILQEEFSFEYLLLYQDRRAVASDGFKVELFS